LNLSTKIRLIVYLASYSYHIIFHIIVPYSSMETTPVKRA